MINTEKNKDETIQYTVENAKLSYWIFRIDIFPNFGLCRRKSGQVYEVTGKGT